MSSMMKHITSSRCPLASAPSKKGMIQEMKYLEECMCAFVCACVYLRLSIPQHSLTPASTNLLSVHATSRRSGCGCVRPCRSTPDDYPSFCPPTKNGTKNVVKSTVKLPFLFHPQKNRETQATDAYVCRACISNG